MKSEFLARIFDVPSHQDRNQKHDLSKPKKHGCCWPSWVTELWILEGDSGDHVAQDDQDFPSPWIVQTHSKHGGVWDRSWLERDSLFKKVPPATGEMLCPGPVWPFVLTSVIPDSLLVAGSSLKEKGRWRGRNENFASGFFGENIFFVLVLSNKCFLLFHSRFVF